MNISAEYLARLVRVADGSPRYEKRPEESVLQIVLSSRPRNAGAAG